MKHFKFINHPPDCLKSLKTVYFSAGSWILDADAKAIIRQNAACLQDNPDIGIILEGHCDKEEYRTLDPDLGKKRAEAVRDYLVQLGVDKNRLELKDRGASLPRAKEENEAAFAKNRRVEFIPKSRTGDGPCEETCAKREGGDGCQRCDGDSPPDCNGQDRPEDCFYGEKCDQTEGECTPDEVCDDSADDCDYCDRGDTCPDCAEKDECGQDESGQECDRAETSPPCPLDSGPCSEGESPLPPPPHCEYCDGEGPSEPPGCGIMEIIPPDCSRDESSTKGKGGAGQSA